WPPRFFTWPPVFFVDLFALDAPFLAPLPAFFAVRLVDFLAFCAPVVTRFFAFPTVFFAAFLAGLRRLASAFLRRATVALPFFLAFLIPSSPLSITSRTPRVTRSRPSPRPSCVSIRASSSVDNEGQVRFWPGLCLPDQVAVQQVDQLVVVHGVRQRE